MSTSLGTLALKFTTDTSGVSTGVNQVKQALGGLKEGATGALGLGFLAGGAAGVTAHLTEKFIELGERGIHFVVEGLAQAAERVDRLAKVSDRLDIPISSLMRMKHAADLAGADFDQLTTAVQKMLVSVGTGGMPVEERLKQIAKQIANTADAGQRAQLAVKYFGKAGVEMINTLVELGDNLERADRLIKDFDTDISRADARGIEEMNDAWTDLKFVIESLFNKTLAAVAPVITAVIEEMLARLKEIYQTVNKTGGAWVGLKDAALLAGAYIVNLLATTAAGFKIMISQIHAACEGYEALQAASEGHFGAAQTHLKNVAFLLGEMLGAEGDLMKGMIGGHGIDFLNKTRAIGEAKGGGRIGGGLTEGGKFAGGYERGSMDAVRATTDAGGNGIGAVASNTREMLIAMHNVDRRLQEIARDKDKPRPDGPALAGGFF